ncbi:hypothetical protein EJ03DRAFT_110326 [Teratosphaeria nubilosa]|uniref:Uncharacterized protein n=1 Tax=Teratosphaeria nubilosa TaxID=161662 RepID=A0A6G1L8H4_9PEZI|nr:hypothetical protein EJ03DRAFT_110326 [Teratosphaeria nubilosa]
MLWRASRKADAQTRNTARREGLHIAEAFSPAMAAAVQCDLGRIALRPERKVRPREEQRRKVQSSGRKSRVVRFALQWPGNPAHISSAQKRSTIKLTCEIHRSQSLCTATNAFTCMAARDSPGLRKSRRILYTSPYRYAIRTESASQKTTASHPVTRPT